MRTALILLAVLATSALAGPTGQRSTCALHCTESETFGYETGKSYVYEYSVTTSTALLGTFDDNARMHITANAHIDVSSPCEYILTLTDVNLEGSSHAPEFSEAITKNPLRFSFQDGVVENLCSEVSEPIWVLNFKRGVLSTFQNSMNQVKREEVQETDISGVCTAHYDITSEGNAITVQKVKDLSSCSQRPDLNAYITSTTYASDSPIQSLPIFKSASECLQKIEGGILKEAQCQETHKYRPFSSEEGGAVTTAKNTLRFISQQQSSAITTDFQFSSTSLVFAEETSSTSEAKIDVVERILDDLKIASQGDINPEVPALFSNLVTALKSLNYPQLSDIYTKVQEPHTRKFLIDAMPLVGTAASAGTVRDMIINGELTETEADVWFTSLAFLKNPNPEIFIAIAPLLEGNPSQKAMLGSSALINNYCKIHTNCESETGVIQVIRRIEAQLGSGCRAVNDQEKTKILVALKALGNAGRWVNANSVLRRCYAEEDNAMEIRVAALEAWRHTPCEYDRSNIQAAFQDENQDPEVRIAAYLALMTCPTQTLMDTIKDKLTSEGVNQVGSFVWTHLTNLQESASPEKQWMRQLIGEELLQNKFSTEALKFSRNFESSFFMNELNTGATVESNVIFSSKSYLPRSAMLNLTLDLFGESINFFEVGGRIEGFESYVERFFGPQGYFPEETVEGILKNMKEHKTDLEPTTLEGFLDKVTDEPEGSYYLRMFGNELHYHHFHGLENIIKSSGATNPLEFLMDLARQGDVDYTKSYQLFDTHYTIPTISGLPLALTAKGTATLGIQMSGNFKARSFKNINIEGHFHPSAAVEIEGLMVVDAHVTHTGLKLTSNLHTSTFLDGKIQINKGKLVDIQFNTPKEKVEVINVQTKFFYLENDEEKVKDVQNKVAYEGCTQGTTGMALCGEFSYSPRSQSSPMFPFVGPYATHVYFKKTDTQTGYILNFARSRNDLSFVIDTPGSQNDHKISLDLTRADNTLTIDIHTPFKSVQGNGEYVWQANNKNLMVKALIDGKQYTMDASFIKNQQLKKFEPSIVLTSPDGELMNLKGLFQRGDKSNDVSMELKTPVLETTINGHLSYENHFISLTTDAEYKFANSNKQTVHQSFLIKKEITNEAGIYSANIEFNPSESSDLFFKLDYKTTLFNLGHIESTGKLVLGPVTWEVEELWLYTNENGQRNINNQIAVKCPYCDIDYLLDMKLSTNRNSVQADMHVRTSPGKDLILTASMSKNRNLELTGNVAAEFGDFKAALEAQYTKIASGQHKVQIITKVRDETHLLEGTLKDSSSAGKINVVIEGLCKCSTYDIKSSLGIYADKEKATVDMKTNIDGNDYTAKLEGSSSSILIDVNIIKHMLLNAYVTSAAETKKVLINAEWDKDVDPTKSFLIDGEISPKSVHLNLKFVEKEVLLSSKLVNNGAELEAKWAQDKMILCNVYYGLGDTKSLAITVQTPFSGFEKQDATFTVSLVDYEMNSKFTATWKNSQQMSLQVKAKVQPGMFTNAMNANILFSSSIANFERINFLLEHSMMDTNINSKIEGIWDDKEIKGSFQLLPNEHGIEGSLTFVSPFTEELLVSLSHKLIDMSLASIIEAKYGAQTSTITLKGHIDFTSAHDVTLVFKMNTPLLSVPQINANVNYNNDGSSLRLNVNGEMEDQKLTLNMNGKLIQGQTTSITGDLRFITPFTYPLTASLKHTHNTQTFTSELEMSRIWSTYGNLKIHAEGQMMSKNDIRLNAVLSSPTNKASLSITHNVAEKKMVSSIVASLNAESISISINGILDTRSHLADLEAQMTSTFNDLDDIKISVKSEKNSNTRTSNFIFTKGDNAITVDHIITINDLLNWENSFKVNGNYQLNNKQTHLANSYTHESQYIWDSKTVHLLLSFDKKNNGNVNEVDTQVLIATPWTNDIKADVHLQYDAMEYKPEITIEYAPGNQIKISSTIKFHDEFFYIDSSLITPFWQTLAYKLNIAFKPTSAVTLVLIRGERRTTIDVRGTWESGKLDGTLEVDTTYLPLPISLEVAYDILSQQKTAHLVITYDQKYEIKGSLSGNLKNAKWSFMTELPTDMLKHMEISGEYNVMDVPMSAKAIFILNARTYEINGQLNTNNFNIDTTFDGKRGSLSGDWFYSHTNSNIQVTFESPVSALESFSMYVMYDMVNDKKVNIKLAKGNQQINLSGKLDNETLLFDGTTPFSGWESLKASFFVSTSAIKAFVSRNDRKIELTGTMHVKPAKGKINLSITTPYANFENISADLMYSFQGPIKTIGFESTFGIQQILLNGSIDITDGLAPEMKLDITTPYDVVRKLGGIVNWNFKGITKTAVVKAFRNDLEYQWQLQATADNLFKGHALTKIITPISGWTSVIVEGSFDFTSMPYKFAFNFDQEGLVKNFEGIINVNHNAISAELTTPIANWEKILLTGDYSFDNNHLTLNTEITKNSEPYYLNGDILFNTQKPKFHIILKTPISYASNIELTFDSNLVDTSKKFLTTLKIDDTTYSIDFSGELVYKTGFVKLLTQSPIPGYNNVEFNAKFDFTDEIKTVEVDLIKENQNQHISVAARVNDNNVFIEMRTPLEDFELMKLDGDYTTINGEHVVHASFIKNNQKYNFQAKLSQQDKTASLKIATPIQMMKTIQFNGKYALLPRGIEVSLHLEKNSDIFDFNTKGIFTPMKSDLVLSVETPVPEWRKLTLSAHYDVLSEKKSAAIIIQKDLFVKKFSFEGSYTLKSGSFKIETPVDGFKILGAEYTLSLNERNNHLDASVKLQLESREWLFSAQGEYYSDKIMIRFQTPFEGFQTIVMEGNIDFDMNTGKGIIEFGSYKFTLNVSYVKDNIGFEITTPFDSLKMLSIRAKYTWTANHKDAILNLIYNDKSYALQATLALSGRTSEILLHATTPFHNFDTMTLKAKYDIDNSNELVSLQMVTNDKNYGLKMGGYIEEKVALLTMEFTSPLSGWTNVKFTSKLDLTSDDKALEISMERDGNIKEISISGKLIGETMNFNLRSPFTGLENFRMSGSLNRAKRSLEFQMMNDAASASFVTNFNSAKLHVKTPFEAAQEINWELTKVNANTLKAEWKRNDNYITLNLEKQGKKNAFNFEVKSEFEAWQFLALTGRLDQETLQGYIRGQVNDDKITITGSGQLDTKTSFSLDIQTPYDNYKSVEVKFDANMRRRVFKLEASSSSSNFHFILERDRSGKITHHSIFPHPDQPTEITMDLGIYNGKMTVTSRYPALRNYLFEYHANVGPVITVNQLIKLNDVEIYKMDISRDGPNKKLDIEVHARSSGHHTNIQLHRDGYSSLNLLVRRDDKEFKIDVHGSGQLPTQGELDIDINNSFRQDPTHIKAHVTLNVAPSEARKHVKVEVTPRQGRLYIFDLNYGTEGSSKKGDFNLAITTPDRSNARWKNISGSWDVTDQNNIDMKVQIGGTEYTAQGKLTLQESTIVLIPGVPNSERIFLQWTFKRDGSSKDYFLKVGRESRYVLLKLKGTIADYAHVDVEGGFKAGHFMQNEFLFTSTWNKQSDGTVNGGGTFTYGNYHGDHTVTFHRDAATKSATFEASGTSNIPNYETVSLSGSYDFNHKAVFHVEFHANNRESKIDFNFSDINPSNSHNTVNINIPILGAFGQMEVTFSHDFRQNSAKSLSAVARFADREAYVKANWNRNEAFDTLEGNIDIKSRFIGEVHIKLNYDVSNIADAHAEVTYARTTPSGQTKNASINWTRKRSADHLETELVIDSPYDILKHGRVYVKADFSNIFHLESGVDYNEKHLTFELEVKKKSITAKITTPFENFQLIDASLAFNLGGKSKTVTLAYARGASRVDLEFVLNMKPKKEGDFTLNLTTPFDFVRNLHVDGKWNKKKAEINYQRNDITMNFSGKADIKADKSSFDLTFSPPNRQTLRIAASYDVKEFLEGSGSNAKKIASLELEFDGNSLSLNVQGYRNSDQLYMEIDGQTSFAAVKEFHLKLDSQLNTQLRDGNFEVSLNDFELKVHNHFERRANNGYYFKSQIESTLTPLPALIFGIGYENQERIITIGYGDDKEITFSIKGKNNFQSGFSGHIDIPNFGYEGLKYDVEYRFENRNQLNINVEVELGGEGDVEAHFVYNSEGVEARLKSYGTGEHSLRVRRSVSSEGFFAEAGIDEYTVKLRGGFSNQDVKRGMMLEGEVFGRKFLIDTLFQSEGLQYTEGKLIIHTPFQGWERLGGMFTWSCVDKKIISRAEMLLPSYTTPKITAEINLNMKMMIDGHITLDMSGQEFTLKSNLVGSISQGYKGTVEILTPFHSLSYVNIIGSFKTNGLASLETDLKIIAPFASHEVQARYNLNANQITANVKLQSNQLYDIYNIDLKIERSGPTSGKLYLDVNNNQVNGQYNIDYNNFLMSLDSRVMGVDRQLSVEAKVPSLDSLESTLTVVLGNQIHKLHGNLSLMKNQIQGAFDIESSLIEGKRKLSFNILAPATSYKQVTFDIEFVTRQTHSVHFDLDATSGLHLSFMIDTPLFPKVSSTFDLTRASIGISVETPSGTHKIFATKRMTRKMPADWIGNLELASPLLPVDYAVNVVVGGGHEKRVLKAEIMQGTVKHLIEGYTAMSSNGGSFSFNIQTPLKNINTASVEASLNFDSKVEMHIAATFDSKVNVFDLTFDKETRLFKSVVESPFIPTGMFKIEAQLTGEMNKNMQVKMDIRNNQQSISGILNFKLISPDHIMTNLKITTPFKGYKKMNFSAEYIKDDDVTLLLTIAKPVKVNAKFNFGHMTDLIKADLQIDTSIQSFKTIESHLYIPLNTFQPRVSANVMMNGDNYGGHLGLRTKAPYELAYGLQAADWSNKFHIRTDSSFFSFLA